jgi:CheY-like chemotaxis protein
MSLHNQQGGRPIRCSWGSILLVEDNEDLREIMIEFLIRMGYSVSGAATAYEALEFIRQGGEATVVVTDVIMPHMNGYDFAIQVRQIRPEIKFLFTSGFPTTPPPNHPFLAKPFMLAQLGQQIRALFLDS